MNMTTEKQNIDGSWYLKDQLNFDKQMIDYRFKSLKKHTVGTSCLELGSAEGVMTKYLVEHFDNVTSVDGSIELLDSITDYKNITKIHSYFEEFNPTQKFDTIIMEHILEHVDDPVLLLNRARDWLNKDGVMLLGVPNANSFHRLAAVKMGLLETPNTLNERDHMVGHRRVYSLDSFKQDIKKSGLNIIETGGVFLKPLSNSQIENNWDQKMIEGFFELGKDFPENAAEIFAVCKN